MQGKLRCSNAADPGDFPFTQLDTSESGALRQWTINWNASWFHWPRTSHKLQFRQLPNQHGTTWAVTSTAQWADCFWECRCILHLAITQAILQSTLKWHELKELNPPKISWGLCTEKWETSWKMRVWKPRQSWCITTFSRWHPLDLTE